MKFWLTEHGLVFSGFKLGRGLSARNVRGPLGDGWSEDGDTPPQLPICIKQSHT
jgi:hypothetical protein